MVHGEQYLGIKPFVVATFASPHDARKVISYAATIHKDDENLEKEVSDAKPFFTDRCINVEFLDEKYAWLLERGTLSRSLSRQVSKWMPERMAALQAALQVRSQEQPSLH
jgi:hypothetical protein